MPNEGRGLGEYQKRQRKPVVIRGTRYESLAAAARALGVSEQTVRRAAKRGTENNIGMRKERADGN